MPSLLARIISGGYQAEVMAGDNLANLSSSFDSESRQWRRRFVGSLLLTLPVFLLSMVLKHLPGVGDGLHMDVAPGLTLNVLVLWVLTTPVQFYFGAPFHRSARAALRHCTFNMDVLVSLGTFAAYGYSLVFIVVALVTSGEQGRDNEQFETAAMLITFILLGKWLEATAKGKASRAVSQLLSMVPPTALQLETCKDIETEPHEVPVAGLRRGDVVKVLPGSQVPVDGQVRSPRRELRHLSTRPHTPPLATRSAVATHTLGRGQPWL